MNQPAGKRKLPMAYSSNQTIIGPMLQSPPRCRDRALFVIVLVLVTLAWQSQVYAADATDTLFGTGAGASLTTGIDDSAFGYQALNMTTEGNFNTALGFQAVFSNTSGRSNTGTGYQALYNNTTGI